MQSRNKITNIIFNHATFFISILQYISTIQLHLLYIFSISSSLTFPLISFICDAFIADCKQILFNIIFRFRCLHGWIVPQVRGSIKLALSQYHLFSSKHVSCHCFCITSFFISFPSIKWYSLLIYFQTLYYVKFYLRRVGFSHWFAGIFTKEVNYAICLL